MVETINLEEPDQIFETTVSRTFAISNNVNKIRRREIAKNGLLAVFRSQESQRHGVPKSDLQIIDIEPDPVQLVTTGSRVKATAKFTYRIKGPMEDMSQEQQEQIEEMQAAPVISDSDVQIQEVINQEPLEQVTGRTQRRQQENNLLRNALVLTGVALLSG